MAGFLFMNPNTGSFGAAIGGADPIQEAMARRGGGAGGAGATAQSSMTQTPIPAQVPQTNPQMPQSSPSMGVNTGVISGMPPKPAESELIIRALSDRLKTFSKIEESQAIPPTPTLTA